MLVTLWLLAIIAMVTIAALEGQAAWGVSGALKCGALILALAVAPPGIVYLSPAPSASSGLEALLMALFAVWRYAIPGAIGLLLAGVALWLVREQAQSHLQRRALLDDPAP